MKEDFANYPLLVDLDGSLIKTDMLLESLVRVLWRKPWLLILIPVWLLNGRAYLKKKLAENSNIDYNVLPFRTEIVDYIQQQRDLGRKIILCTGAWQGHAEGISNALGLFDQVHGTSLENNLTGSNKAKWAIEQFGEKNFSYIGNETKDIHIWKHAATALVVSKNDSLLKQAESVSTVEKHFKIPGSTLSAAIKSLRPHQWVKNLLLFIPLLSSHLFISADAVMDSLIAFSAFCFCASSTYILNDLSDIDSDRNHRTKHLRPLASGSISIQASLLLSGLLMVAALLIASLLSQWFFGALILYVVITVAYSIKLKQLQTVDIIVLASLYTLRVIAGAATIEVLPSFWLLSFSMFIFISLAFAKRLSELIKTSHENPEVQEIRGRGYYVSDISILLSLGSSSGLISVLVFALYISSEDITNLYAIPELLWLICPALAYWIIRTYILTARNELDEDPISFAIKDRNSWVVAMFIVSVLVMAN